MYRPVISRQNKHSHLHTTFCILMSGGKNIGKTALKNQLMDLLRTHTIRHDKVPTFTHFILIASNSLYSLRSTGTLLMESTLTCIFGKKPRKLELSIMRNTFVFLMTHCRCSESQEEVSQCLSMSHVSLYSAIVDRKPCNHMTKKTKAPRLFEA